ncbi:hypothetical protein B0T17DRAFT_533987 [Bombardia bombarda]|uniref:Uncharacterized protein n=1 Tax=Bombardia bombarda TaxID=252184 RepID=A0AA39WTN9_9PEZI|nr:hypothetical protein B0T17DRAFT_533987 [Bombardia bombarda]
MSFCGTASLMLSTNCQQSINTSVIPLIITLLVFVCHASTPPVCQPDPLGTCRIVVPQKEVCQGFMGPGWPHYNSLS